MHSPRSCALTSSLFSSTVLCNRTDSHQKSYNIPMKNSDEYFMEIALQEAQRAFLEDEVPVGACVVFEGKVIAQAHNRRERTQNPLLHAEIEAIEKASTALQRWRLNECTLYVTLEPCLMCAGAIIQARIKRLVFGAPDPKGGVVQSRLEVFALPFFNHKVEVTGGILAERCSQILREYFKIKRGEVAELDEGARLEIE
ncbi:MAG: tRNA adenosine(34) deaminase TadA [Candidatus Caldatribacteriaceae bacterium]